MGVVLSEQLRVNSDTEGSGIRRYNIGYVFLFRSKTMILWHKHTSSLFELQITRNTYVK